MRRSIATVLLVAAVLATAGVARGTIFVGADATRITLGVDASGTAVVTFVSAGKRDTVVVPPRGQLVHGGALSGRDVSRRTQVPGLTLASTARRTPDGRLWALQAWQIRPGGPLELHLARWKGEPTRVTLELEGERLTGTATFQGKPVTGRTFTLEGKRPRIFAYLDCFACGGQPGWTRMIGIPPKANGSFGVALRPAWTGPRYRATVAGPNIGATFAPDAQIEIVGAG